MSTFAKLTAALALIGSIFLIAPDMAQARHYHSYGWGFGFGFGRPYSYYYPPPVYYGPPVYYAPEPYYYGPVCRTVRVRVWSYGAWHIRRVRRCY